MRFHNNSQCTLIRRCGWGLLLCVVSLSRLAAQVHFDFEQSTPTWQLRETDCSIPSTTWIQQRTSADCHDGKSCEYFHFQSGHGTKIFVVHPISPAYLIDELKPSLWLKSKRADIQLKLRVVLPHAPAPDGSGPIKVMLDGVRYTSVGNWQQLDFSSTRDGLLSLFQQQLWLLRTKFGAEIDPHDAYVDMVVLNLYTGPGVNEVWVDDLEIVGAVDAQSIATKTNSADERMYDPNVVRAAAQEPMRDAVVHFDGNIMEVGGQPFAARIILHNGEPFEFLQRIGFNVIELRSPADDSQLQKAAQLGLWLICPPPPNVGLQPIGAKYERVLAWSVGRNLDGRDLENVQHLIKEIRYSDPDKSHPLVADVRSNWSDYGKVANILSTGVEVIGGSFPLSRYDQWLAQRQQLAGRVVPLWAAIPTELGPEVQSQIAVLANRVPPTPIDASQLEAVLYEAIAGGARGLRFISRSRLDATDPVTQLRVQTLKWLNIRINQIEPWIAAGAVLEKVPVNQPGIDVAAVQTDQARLLLIQRTTGREQWVAGDTPLDKVAFVDVGALPSDKAYWLSTSGMIPMPVSNIHGGAAIEIEKCPSTAAVVITESPVVVNRIARAYQSADGLSLARLGEDITRNWLAITQLLDREMGRLQRSGAVSSGAINEAITDIQQAEAMSQRNNLLTADAYFGVAAQRLALARRHFLVDARKPFMSSMPAHC